MKVNGLFLFYTVQVSVAEFQGSFFEMTAGHGDQVLFE